MTWAFGSPELPGAGPAPPPHWSCFGHHPWESGRRVSSGSLLRSRSGGRGCCYFPLRFFLMWIIFQKVFIEFVTISLPHFNVPPTLVTWHVAY